MKTKLYVSACLFVVITSLVFLIRGDRNQRAQREKLFGNSFYAPNHLTEENSRKMKGNFAILFDLAKKGDAEAQYKIGDHYFFGIGVPQNYENAVKWYKKSAEQGCCWGEHNLALCYAKGTGIKKDALNAFQLWLRAAKQGHAPAQSNLGACYFYGMGTSVDHAEAANWYRKAAEQGDYLAAYNLSLCYEKGTGVANDLDEAATWLLKSAEGGYARAQWKYSGYCYRRGDIDEMIRWLQESASQDFPEAQYNLGILYDRNVETPRDREVSIQWMRKAAANGDTHAKEWLKQRAINP